MRIGFILMALALLTLIGAAVYQMAVFFIGLTLAAEGKI